MPIFAKPTETINNMEELEKLAEEDEVLQFLLKHLREEKSREVKSYLYYKLVDRVFFDHTKYIGEDLLKKLADMV